MRPANGAFFPLDERWGIAGSKYSPELARDMVWLSGLATYQASQTIFARIGKRHIPSSAIWRQSQVHGERLQKRLAASEADQEKDIAADEKPAQGASLDGGMVHIRGEGWKEFKVGAVFDIEQRLEYDSRTQRMQWVPHATRLDYTAVLGSVQIFEPAFKQLAQPCGFPQVPIDCVNGDGADWVWNLATAVFPDSTHIVDGYHARQRLIQAAHAYHADDKTGLSETIEEWTDALFAGDVDDITRPLDDAGLTEHSRYFHHHRERMQYHDFREAGLPIGSGTIESGVKQFKARLTGAGMRWSRPGAERMLGIRSAVLGRDFDRLWDAA